MSADLVIGLVLGLFIGCLATLVYLLWRVNRNLDAPSITPAAAEPEAPSRHIDPENPPQWRVYRPQRNREAPRCNCHDRPLEPEQPVLWWPVLGSDSGEVELICEEGAGVDAPI